MQFLIRQRIDRRAPNAPLIYAQIMELGDKSAHRWEVEIADGGQPFRLNGESVSGFVRRGDGATLYLTGAVEDGKAVLTLPSGAYGAEGWADAVMRVTESDALTAVAQLAYRVSKHASDAVIDPDHIVPDLSSLLAQIETMRQVSTVASAAVQGANAAAQAAYGARDAANSAAQNANNAAASASQSIREIVTASDTAIAGADAAATRADEAALAANAAAQVVADSYIPQLTIGTVEDVAQDAAYATITGTLQAPRLNLGLPRGLDGPGALYAQPENPEITTLTLSDDATGALETRIQQVEAAVATKGGKALWVNMGTISSLPVTKNVAGVTTDMVCAEAVLGTPSAQVSDWTVNTDVAGKVTVSGTISGSTTLNVLLVPRDYKTAT